MSSNLTVSIIIMAVLVMMSAYFSATETAFSSLNKTRLKTIAEKGDKKAKLALSLSERYDKLISTILIGNNIVNIAVSSMATVLFVRYYGDAGATVSTVIVTVIVLIFGEISPKSLAKNCPERFAMFSAPFLRVILILFTPLNILFTGWQKILNRIFRLEQDTKMSQEELLMLVDEVEQDGSIDEEEGELLRNAIEFKEQDAEDILTHRVDLEAVPVDADKTEIARVFTETKFSRLLVYGENIDNILGVIHQKDFYTGSGITEKDVKEIMTPVVFALQNEKLSNLLRHLQKNKSHIAVVVDEYGGTSGIVTMEDILEELVGEIWDEHDEIAILFREAGKNCWLVDASVDLDEFCDQFEIETESEMVSLSGWVMEQVGQVPVAGDRFLYENLEITVTRVDNHRVMEVRVRVTEPAVVETDEE